MMKTGSLETEFVKTSVQHGCALHTADCPNERINNIY